MRSSQTLGPLGDESDEPEPEETVPTQAQSTDTSLDGKARGESKAQSDSNNASQADNRHQTVLVFVRHGQTPTTGDVLPGRAPGLHLSEQGQTQAQDAARRVAALGRVGAIYASPMERTLETAKPIAAACGLEIREHYGLVECDFGDWTGCKLSELRKLEEWNTVQHNPAAFRFPGGESFVEMQARALDAATSIAQSHKGDIVVAVSHADVIKAVLASAAGTPLDLFQRIVVSPCSLSVIAYTPQHPVVLTVNNTGETLVGFAKAAT